MSETLPTPEIINPEQQAVLQTCVPALRHGWGLYEGVVESDELLKSMHEESLSLYDSATKYVPGHYMVYDGHRRGEVTAGMVNYSELAKYPVTQSFVHTVARNIGKRLLTVRFHFYEPRASHIPRRNGHAQSPETTTRLSVIGEGEFTVLPDADLGSGFGEPGHFPLNPNDLVVLPPIPSGVAQRYTSRTHGLKNAGRSEHIVLTASFS